MPRINSQSSRLPEFAAKILSSPRATGWVNSRGRAGGPQTPQAPRSQAVERVKDEEELESFRLAPFELTQVTGHTNDNRPSVSEILKFFREGTDSTPPPSSPYGFDHVAQGTTAHQHFPPIATLLSGPIRTQSRSRSRHPTPSIADYTRSPTPTCKGVKVEGGDDLLSFLANVAVGHPPPKPESTSTKLDSKFEEEVDELDSDSDSGCAPTSRRETKVGELYPESEDDNNSVVCLSSPPPVCPAFEPIKAIPSDMTTRFIPQFPWEFYACDIQRGLARYDAACLNLGGVTQTTAQFLLEEIFDGARVSFNTFRIRRAEIETEEGGRLLGRFARMGRVPGASFLCYLRAVRGDPWFTPSKTSSIHRIPRRVKA